MKPGFTLAVKSNRPGRFARISSARSSPANQISLWRIPDGSLLASHPAEQDWYMDVPHLAVVRDLSVAAHGTRSGILCVDDLATGKERWKAKAWDLHIIALAFSPDAKILASSAGFVDSEIRLFEVASGRESDDTRTPAAGYADGTLELWNVPQRALTRRLTIANDPIAP